VKIVDVAYSIGRSAFMNKDLKAIKAGAKQNGSVYLGEPMAPGFTRIMQPGVTISVMLVLEDGQVAFGDCADVILTGFAGRDPIFRAQDHIDYLRGEMRDRLIGQSLLEFRPLAEMVEACRLDEKPLHTALRYGITQALLHGASLARHVPMAAIIAREYNTTISGTTIPILASIHNEDAAQLDRMILKRVELLPHGSFQQVERDIGLSGEKLMAFATHLSQRISEIRDPDYTPRIHLDVYGTLGELFANDVERISDYLGRLRDTVRPYDFLIETPAIAATQDAQIELFIGLKTALKKKGVDMGIIADEWCNTVDDIKRFADAGAADYVQIKTPDLGGIHNSIEAVLYCKTHAMGCCLGGTANETDQSARICTHIGLATKPDFMLSKPGLGGDEALMIQTNEMERTLALLARNSSSSAG
jgi:methylaspartate ammonia-lyase